MRKSKYHLHNDVLNLFPSSHWCIKIAIKAQPNIRKKDFIGILGNMLESNWL